MELSNLQPAAGSKHSDNFRRGRGHGSGNGKTAGKGHKGGNLFWVMPVEKVVSQIIKAIKEKNIGLMLLRDGISSP